MLNLNYIYISYNIIHIIYICYKIYLKIHYIKSKTLAKFSMVDKFRKFAVFRLELSLTL